MQNRFAKLDIFLINFYFGDPLAAIRDGKNHFWLNWSIFNILCPNIEKSEPESFETGTR